MTTGSLLIVAGTARPGRCKYCGKAFVWMTVARQPGRPARTLPFDARPMRAITERDPVTGVTFERWPEDTLHRFSCTNRPKQDHTQARMRRASQDRQGRFL